MKLLVVIFLQDVAAIWVLHPERKEHPMFSMPVFQDPEWLVSTTLRVFLFCAFVRFIYFVHARVVFFYFFYFLCVIFFCACVPCVFGLLVYVFSVSVYFISVSVFNYSSGTHLPIFLCLRSM